MSDNKNNTKKSDSFYNNKKINVYKNKKINNNESNIMGITSYLSKLKKNYSQEYFDFNKRNKRKELNTMDNLTMNIDSNNKSILIDNKKSFKKIYQNKKINLKNPLYTKIIINNIKINNNSNINKSTNYIDSKSLDETKSKLDYQNNTNINQSINLNINPNINNNENFINSQNQIKNEFQDEIQKENQNENQEKIPKKIILPQLYKSTKKNFKRETTSYIIKSKHQKISANDIYLHYIKENEIEKSKNKIEYNSTIVEFHKYLKDNDNKRFNYSFEKIYGDDKNFIKIINELKKNKNIAYKKDFNIQDYQKTLMKLLKKRISDKSMENLDKSYKLFNERNFGMMMPRGRYIDLAEKLKDFLSKDIFENMKRMDRNYKIFLEKNEEMKHRRSIEFKNRNNFYKNLNKTIISFGKKKEKKEKKWFDF